jgi:2-keto-4-pentenoate hydratase/2-oxohepta-3-ene-1,7-dioic acid hydratase in catechol pathway
VKLLSFRKKTTGETGCGALVEGGIADLTSLQPNLKSLLEHVPMAELQPRVRETRPSFSLESIELLPVIPQPDKILCVGINYAAHRDEMGRVDAPYPTLFTRFTSTLVAHGQPLIAPKASQQLDYEAELAVVIGKRARRLTLGNALDAVAGFTCFNDGSVRDWQQHTTQFTAGKNFIGTGALGPWLVTRDELPNPSGLRIQLRLNGQTMQDARTDELIFDVPALLVYISTFTELVPGDIIATGTPSGVGSKRKPPVFLKAGDQVEVELEKIGVLRNPVAAER